MKRETWVLLVVLAVLAAVAWWIWKKPQGVTSVGPILSATPAPTPQPVQQYYPDGTPVPDTTSGYTNLGRSAVSTVTISDKAGLGVGQSGGLLL